MPRGMKKMFDPTKIKPTKEKDVTRAIAKEYFEQFNSDNGWGMYEHFVPFVEKYLNACKENPESYIQWGKEKFFTDAKRGVVLKLQGAGQSEALQIISDTGMDSWFRDLFQESVYTQKLGGYDPYMDEYVLHSNNIQVPIDTPILDCGAVRDIVVAEDNSFIYKIDYGNYVGVTGITYNITAGSVDINISHDGINTTYNNLTGSGTATFNKLNPSPNIATITVSNDAATTAEGTLTFNCTTRIPATVVQLTVNSNEDASKSITNQYSYNFNNLDYPGDSTNLQLSSGEFPIVSQDATRSGFLVASHFSSNERLVRRRGDHQSLLPNQCRG